MFVTESKKYISNQTTTCTHAGEVFIYMLNDGDTKVEAISGNISAYGYIPGEFTTGKINIRDIVYDKDIPGVMMHARKHLENKSERFACDCRILEKNGTPVWVTNTIIPTYNAEGVATHFFVKFENINRNRHNDHLPGDANESSDAICCDVAGELRSQELLRRSEQRLKESNELLESIIEAIPAPLCVKNKQGVYIRCNSLFSKIYNLTKEQIIGKKAEEVFPEFSGQINAFDRTQLDETGDSEIISVYAPETETIIYRNFLMHHGKKEGIVGVMFDVSELKRQLITERNRLQVLGDNFPNGCLFRLEVDNRTKQVVFTYLSKTWEQHTGLKATDVLKNSDLVFRRMHPDDLPQVMQWIKTPDEHNNFSSRIRYHHPCGNTLWLRVSVHRHFEDDQRIYDGFILDITPYQLAEQELEDSYKRQHLLYKVLQIFQSSENISRAIRLAMDEMGKYLGIDRICIAERDSDNTYEWCNNGIAALKKRLRDFRAVYDRFNNGNYIQVSGQVGLSPDIMQFHKDAGIMSALCFPLVTDGINYGYVCYDDCTRNRKWNNNEIELLGGLSHMFANTIRRHRAEMSIRLSQQTLRTVMDNINSNIVVTDFDSHEILFANRKIKEDLGDDDIEGKICWKVLRTGQKGPCEYCPHPHLRNAQNNPTGFYKWEYHNKLPGKWYECIDTAIEWVDGRMVHLQHALDITHRKTDELELIRARKKAEDADRLKSAFLANISHEIRTPLNGINGFLQFLTSGDLALELRQKYVQVVNTCSRQLIRLIDDVIDIAKVEANSLNVFPVVTDINRIMRDLVPVFDTELKVQNKGTIALLLDDTGFIHPGVTYVDPVRLQQTLFHLIDNAIKFTHKGYIRFGYKLQTPGMLEFEVEDTGIGIPEEMYEIIFERFRQVEQGNNHFHRGTGIGLTISQNLVELMGGRMWLQSAVGEGSTFSFTIPYLPVAPDDTWYFDETTDKRTVSYKPFFGKIVLLVESGILKYRYYEKLLAAGGFNVIEANDTQQWLDHVSRCNNIDIIVTGTSVIDDANNDLIRKINSIHADVPLVCLGNIHNDRKQNFGKNRNKIIVKEPVDYARLMEAIGKVMVV